MRIYIRVVVSILLLVTLTSEPKAQGNFEVFSATWGFFPDSKIADTSDRPNLADVETKLGSLELRLASPIAGSPEGDYLVLGKASYDQLEFNFNNDNLPQYQPDLLHEVSIELTYRRRLSEQWFMTGMVMPNIASDFMNSDGFLKGNTALNVDAGLVLNKRLNRSSGFGFGVRFTTDFGEALFLPALIYRRTTERFRVAVVLPKQIEVMYLPGPGIEIGVAGHVSGNHYRIGEEATLANNISLEEGRIKYSVITAGPSFRFGLSSNVFLSIEGGAALQRRFQVFDKDDNELDTLDLEKSFTLRGGLQLRR